MSTAERVPKPPELAPYDELTPPPVEDLHARPQPSPKRTTRRWEIGFFVRKIVNGWLAYYKQFPSARNPSGPSPELPPGHDESGQAESLSVGVVRPLSGHGMTGDDGGPVGQTRYEAGFFVQATTGTSESQES